MAVVMRSTFIYISGFSYIIVRRKLIGHCQWRILSALFTPFHKMLGVKSTAAYGVVYPKEEYWKCKSFMEPDSGAKSYLFCHTDAPSAILKPAGDYAIIYHKGPFEEIYQTYEILFRYLTTNDFELDGDIHEECLLHSIVTDTYNMRITELQAENDRIRASYENRIEELLKSNEKKK